MLSTQLPDMNLVVALDALLDEGKRGGGRAANEPEPGRHEPDPILVRAGRGLVPTPKALELREQVRDLVEQAALLFRSADDVCWR